MTLYVKDGQPRTAVTEIPTLEGEPMHTNIETRHYSDGSSATGPAPLPDLSPDQQDAREAVAAACSEAEGVDNYPAYADRVISALEQRGFAVARRSA